MKTSLAMARGKIRLPAALYQAFKRAGRSGALPPSRGVPPLAGPLPSAPALRGKPRPADCTSLNVLVRNAFTFFFVALIVCKDVVSSSDSSA